MWSVLAVAAVIAHYVFLAYLIAGGFLAWRWSWSIGTHVLTAIWAILIVTTKVPCPLTALQNTAREHLGQRPLSGGFIHIYARGVLYPIGWDRVAQIVVGVVVLSSWIGFAVRRRTARRAGSANRDHGARRPAAELVTGLRIGLRIGLSGATAARGVRGGTGWAFAVPVVLIGSWIVADAVQPRRYDAVRQTVSVTAGHGGTDRWIMTSAFLIAAALYVVLAYSARTLTVAARLGLVAIAVTTTGIAACPEPRHGTTLDHLAWTTAGAVLLALWPLLAARRRALSWPESIPVSICASAVYLLSFGWLAYAALAGTHVGLAERVSSSLEVWWPAVVLSSRRQTAEPAWELQFQESQV